MREIAVKGVIRIDWGKSPSNTTARCYDENGSYIGKIALKQVGERTFGDGRRRYRAEFRIRHYANHVGVDLPTFFLDRAREEAKSFLEKVLGGVKIK